MMVGLKVVLEGRSGGGGGTNKINYYSNTSRPSHQVVSQASIIIAKISPSPNPFSRTTHTLSNTNFLDDCFLCRKKLLPSHDIYMYKGDRAFCSEECRSREMHMDEKEAAMKAKTKRGDSCSFSAINHHASSSPSSRKGPTKRSNGIVY